MNILITGFEPFGKNKANPSIEAVRLLPDEIEGIHIIKEELPVVFGLSSDQLIKKVRSVSPSAVICTGLAASREAVTPEIIAVNLRNAVIEDNRGNMPQWEKIDPSGEDGLFSTLPVQKMTQALTAQNYPAKLSFSAGTFVCNEVMYSLLAFQRKEAPHMRAGFIHVPCASEYDDTEGVFHMPVREISDALCLCVKTLIREIR